MAATTNRGWGDVPPHRAAFYYNPEIIARRILIEDVQILVGGHSIGEQAPSRTLHPESLFCLLAFPADLRYNYDRIKAQDSWRCPTLKI